MFYAQSTSAVTKLRREQRNCWQKIKALSGFSCQVQNEKRQTVHSKEKCNDAYDRKHYWRYRTTEQTGLRRQTLKSLGCVDAAYQSRRAARRGSKAQRLSMKRMLFICQATAQSTRGSRNRRWFWQNLLAASLTSFFFNVLTQKYPDGQCLCDTCVNPMIKMSKLKQMTEQPIKTVDELVLETVCGIFTRDCVERACSLCGVDQFCTRLCKTLQQQEQLNQSVVWRKWEKIAKIADKVGKRSCGEKRGLCWPCQNEA